MKTQRELNLHYWGAIHDMVEAYNKEHRCDVKPWECVGFCGDKKYCEDHPYFNSEIQSAYEFAVAILYDEQAGVHRPLFPGDEVYWATQNMSGEVFDWANGLFSRPEDYSLRLSWHKPQLKRTFRINGVELPCPTTNVTAPQKLFVWGQDFYFDRVGDDAMWREAIRKLLTEARDKEVV